MQRTDGEATLCRLSYAERSRCEKATQRIIDRTVGKGGNRAQWDDMLRRHIFGVTGVDERVAQRDDIVRSHRFMQCGEQDQDIFAQVVFAVQSNDDKLRRFVKLAGKQVAARFRGVK